nr:hypothetical protein [Tanacetum cinerariifolium]
MERNKSIHRSDEQKNLYKALVDAYESNKLILDTYGDIVTIKRRQDDQDEDEEPFAGLNRGSKRRRAGKEPKSTSAPKENNSKSMGKSKKGSKSHQEHTGKSNIRADERIMKKPVELEYFLEEVCKATTDKFDLNNPEGQQYPHDLRKPLPLIPNSRGRQVIPFEHFINNDLAYLSGGVSSRIYTTSVTKTKAADYGHIKWIEDLVLNAMWTQVPVSYDKHALWESHIGGENDNNSMDLLLNRESAHDVYSKRRIIVAQSFKLSNGIIISIWIGSLFVETMISCINSKKAISKGFAFKISKTCCFFLFKAS